MFKKIQLLYVVFAIPAIFSENTDYCQISTCLPRSHTICRFPHSEPPRRCSLIIRRGLNPYEIFRILQLHNEFRFHVYSGQERRGDPGPQPASTHVAYLEWDEELALIAQRWTEQCITANDRCRDVERFPVSQIFSSDVTFGSIKGLSVEWIVRKWYNEVEKFNKSNVKNYSIRRALNTHTYHYTQMIWANSTKFGCGAIRHYRLRFKRLVLICNYGPAGNLDGQPLYLTTE